MSKFRGKGFKLLVAMLVLAAVGSVGKVTVWAAMGLSSQVDVEIVEPPGVQQINVFTAGGVQPNYLPIEMEAYVDIFSAPTRTLPLLTGVDFALNGTVDEVARTITNADAADVGIRVSNVNDSSSEWVGVLDLARGTFTEAMARPVLAPTLVSTSILRAVATIDEYYTGPTRASASGFDDYDEIDIAVNVYDAAAVDPNGNLKPDAEGLVTFPEGLMTGTGPSGGIIFTTWKDLGGSVRGGQVEATLTLDSLNGPINVDILAPTLAQIQAVSSAYDGADDGRLLVTVGVVPTDILDGPAGVNPLGEFDLTDGGLPIPPPQSVFALVHLLVRDVDVDPTAWIALETLPAGVEITVVLSGPGVAAFITTGDDIRAYTYRATNLQDAGGELTDIGAQEGWVEISVALSDDLNVTRATAAAGDDTITATLSAASVIVGSNAVSPVTTGSSSGSSGGCFIATAAYGTPLASDIDVLRGVRDRYMLNNALGSTFADLYYRLSPPVADAVAHHPLLATAVRAVLTPIVLLSGLVFNAPMLAAALMLGVGLLITRRIVRRTRNA